MTIDKAIEILELVSDTPPSGANLDFEDAIKLGIEALKRVKAQHQDEDTTYITLLPGEDPE